MGIQGHSADDPALDVDTEATVGRRPPRSIILFSDGTGNSSAKLFKTNVWRMYEAVHLGPPVDAGDRLQVAYYDNGVGTSNFRPVAMITGVFGAGLKRNILHIYRFLCRNYQPGDEIYVFGFSRGAFTVRLLVGLIASQGIVKYESEGALAYQARDAYRAFCASQWPNRWLSRKVAGVLRGFRNALIGLKRRAMNQRLYSRTERHETDIAFVGVWDTVAAYGGPIAEITRGIDDWIWPLTMPHYGLTPKVRKARHALALDDERDAFQPLLWDEVREQEMVDRGEVSPGRLEQVWFTGMHADVGGGYPDESLSYVSLLWMMDEVAPDVKLIPHFVDRARSLANPYGPLHDNRQGFGAYYRYQPRKISALVDPVDQTTLSLRDPEVSRGMREHGLLKRVRIHESAIARIVSGTDKYAPLALPEAFEVVPARGPAAQRSLTDDQLREIARMDGDRRKQRAQLQENAWDLVWRRRGVYFLTVFVSLLLAAIPLYTWLDWLEDYCGDDRCFASKPLQWLGWVIPETAKKLLAHYAEKPVLTIVGVIAIMSLMGIGRRLEYRLRDRMRRLWSDYFAGRPLNAATKPRLRRFREHPAYQRSIYLLKWKLLPALFGWLLIAVLAYGALLLATQTYLAFAEPRISCEGLGKPQGGPAGGRNESFKASTPCTNLNVYVTGKKTYRLTLKVTKDWKDWHSPASPGVGVHKAEWSVRPFALYRRVTKANWLKPLIGIRSYEVEKWWHWPLRVVMGPSTHIRIAEFRQTGPREYVADIKAKRSGHLYMMLNDAALPFWPGAFYGNNEGEAEVSVVELPDQPAPAPAR